jgi:predicted NBD/HSP70 family sugar kinase
MEKATLKSAREHNTRLVLKRIYSSGPISRAELARHTNLTPPTVSDVVANLIDQGLVSEVGYAPSSSGRRAILLEIIEDSKQLIGIDLSRQDFRGAIADLRGQIKYRIDLPLDNRDGDAALAMVYKLVDSLIENASSPLLGIGIGSPGLVDSHNGVLQQSVNLNWRYIPFRNLLQSRYDLPIYMANDCQVAALAVHTFNNSYKDEIPLIVINAGWGVGSGIILNNQLLHGYPVGAGEIGHVAVVENGDLCACGNRGCLETVASSRAIIKRVKKLIENNPGSVLNNLGQSPEQIMMENVIQAFNAGNEHVRGIVYDAGRALGVAAAYFVGIFGRCRIMVRGDVSQFGQFLIDTMWEEMEKRTLPTLARVSSIGILEVGPDIVIKGATALVLKHELGVL